MKSFSELFSSLLHPGEAKPPLQIINTQVTLPPNETGADNHTPPADSKPEPIASSSDQISQPPEQPTG